MRERGHEMLQLALEGAIPGWRVDLGQLAPAADLVAQVTRERYPDLQVPFHARWRHFVLQDRDLWAELLARADWPDPQEPARAAFDLAIVSVLLDAGAGMAWRYRDPETGAICARSEGLAVASLRMFEAGAFSQAPYALRADALWDVTPQTLASGFQLSAENPLVGVEGRAALLRRLGEQTRLRPDLFALRGDPRPGGLYDLLAARAVDGRLPATAILEALLEGLGPIWPNRLTVRGLPLGDTWRHPAIRRGDDTDGLAPLHKLSQWLAYSLVEPLQAAGLEVTDIDGLTGLAEYRNGGLFLDIGVLAPTDPAELARRHEVGDPFVVAWRAMTVALLDRLAPMVRERLGVSAEDFPLARVLEGGAWAAGRRLAAQARADGGPPFAIASDGAVF